MGEKRINGANLWDLGIFYTLEDNYLSIVLETGCVNMVVQSVHSRGMPSWEGDWGHCFAIHPAGNEGLLVIHTKTMFMLAEAPRVETFRKKEIPKWRATPWLKSSVGSSGKEEGAELGLPGGRIEIGGRQDGISNKQSSWEWDLGLERAHQVFSAGWNFTGKIQIW